MKRFAVRVYEGYFGGNFGEDKWEVVDAPSMLKAREYADTLELEPDDFIPLTDDFSPFSIYPPVINRNVVLLKDNAPKKIENQSFLEYISKWAA